MPLSLRVMAGLLKCNLGGIFLRKISVLMYKIEALMMMKMNVHLMLLMCIM